MQQRRTVAVAKKDAPVVPVTVSLRDLESIRMLATGSAGPSAAGAGSTLPSSTVLAQSGRASFSDTSKRDREKRADAMRSANTARLKMKLETRSYDEDQFDAAVSRAGERKV